MQVSKITYEQWIKVAKALAYSFGAGFMGGFILTLTGVLTTVANGGALNVNGALAIAVVTGGIVGGLNALAVTVKQLFTPAQ